MLKRVSIVTIIFFLFQTSVALAICPAGFINPITDIAWTCTFPIRFAGIVITPKGKDPGTWVRDPICVCTDPFPRIGLTLGLWEPARMIEVVKDPFCFPSLGFQLSMGNNVFEGGSSEKKDRKNKQGTYFAQAHYFIFPIWTMLELLIDFICLEHSGFDLAYMTELDPLWNDDMLTLFINPEAILFGNPAAQFICIADSAAAAVNFSIDSLFWCMGSWGSTYPMSPCTRKGVRQEGRHSPLLSLQCRIAVLANWQTTGPRDTRSLRVGHHSRWDQPLSYTQCQNRCAPHR